MMAETAKQKLDVRICGVFQKQIPVSVFVSMVSRTTRISTKLEKLPLARLSCQQRYQSMN